jgi:two-component system sensor kinase FixL
LRALLEEVRSGEAAWRELRTEHVFAGIGRRAVSVRAHRVEPDDGGAPLIAAAIRVSDGSAPRPFVPGAPETSPTDHPEAGDQGRAADWLRSLIDMSQDAVVSIDRRGRIMLFNPAAERMFGYSKAEVQGRSVAMLMPEPYASEHQNYIEHYELTGIKRAIGRIRTVSARRKNGEVFPIELSVTEVAARDQVQYAAFIRDISEKVKLQEEMIERERLAVIGTTAAKFAHEVGNPLNGMYMTVQLLERRLAKHKEELGSTFDPIVRNLMGEVKRLTALLDDFRSLSRRQKLTLRPVSVAPLVEEVLALEELHYRSHGIRVEKHVPAHLDPIVADREKLKQVLLNLCRNAAEAMPRGGRLALRVRTEANDIVLEVEDTGHGIPEGADIFSPFTTTKPYGTGLGLTIVQQIVSAHKGTITYASETGKGTVFRVALPLKPPAEQQAN